MEAKNGEPVRCEHCGEYPVPEHLRVGGQMFEKIKEQQIRAEKAEAERDAAIELLRDMSWWFDNERIVSTARDLPDRVRAYLAPAPEPSEPDPLCPKCQGLGQGGDCLCEQEPSEPVSEDRLQNMLDRCTGPDAPGVVMQDVKDLIADLRQAREEIASERRLKRQWQDAELKSRARIAELEKDINFQVSVRSAEHADRKREVATLAREKNALQGAFEAMKVERDEARADLRDEIDSWKHDSVASLRARIAELENEHRDAAERLKRTGYYREPYDEARAEVARLRPIAEEMATQDCESYCGAEHGDGHECWPSIARAALRGEGPEGGK